MTGLDLGALVGRVVLDTTSFDRAYMRTVGRLSAFGREANKAAAGTDKLDASLNETAAAANRSTEAVSRNTKATIDNNSASAKAAAAEQRAAAAARLRSDATVRLSALMGELAGQTAEVQQATLRFAAAQERAEVAAGRGNAVYARQVSAQASLIGSQQRLTRATTEMGAASSEASAGFIAGLGGMVRMAGELGVIVGGIELVKKALDISSEAREFDRQMVTIETQAGATVDQLKQFSPALLAMSGKVAQSPEALATSLYHVYSATKTLGYTPVQMLHAVEIAAKGATISGADLEDTTNALTATMVAGMGHVNNMASAMAALNSIVGQGDMKQQDLNEALGTGVLVMAKTFGVTLAQAGAALDVFGDNNIRGAKAATYLRMSVQDLAKPAATAEASLAGIGLTTTKLRDDLEKGGLSLALRDLKTHLEAAGVTGNKVGGFLEDAFTKRAGAGLAVLLNNLDQFDQKQQRITHDSQSLGTEWAAATKTASFALSSLWAKIQAGGIVIARELNPAIASAVRWLGTAVPHALSVLAQILGPTVRMVGGALVGAWKLLVAVLGPVASVLGDIGHWMAHTEAVAHGLIPMVVALWAAFKGYAIVMGALRAINGALITLRLRMMAAGSAGTSAGSMIRNSMTGGQAAVAGVTVVLTALIYNWQKHQAAVAAWHAETEQDTTDIVATLDKLTGAITRGTRAWVQQKLTNEGAYSTLAKFGLTYSTITNAALGYAGAQRQVAEATQGWRTSSMAQTAQNLKALGILNQLGISVENARHRIQQHNAVVAQSAANTRVYARSMTTAGHAAALLGSSANGATRPMQHLSGTTGGLGNTLRDTALAGNALAKAIANLGGKQMTTAQSEIQFQQDLAGLKAAWDKNSNAIMGNSKAALQNRAALIPLLQDAKQHAADLQAQGAGVDRVRQSLLSQISAIKGEIPATAAAQRQWHALLATLHMTPHDITTKFHGDTTDAMRAITKVQQAISHINGTIILHTKYAGGGSSTGGAQLRASGGGAPEGWYWTGERGPELSHKSGPRTDIYSASQSRRIAPMLGFRVPGYAGGTGGGSGHAGGGYGAPVITTIGSGKNEQWVFRGTKYQSLTAAQNALNSWERSHRQSLISGANSAISGITASGSGFSWNSFLSQIARANQAIAKAAAAGASKKTLDKMEKHLAKIEQQGARAEKRLGRQALNQANALGRTVGNLANPASASTVLGSIRTLESTLQQAGLPRKFIQGLRSENRAIGGLVRVRNAAAAAVARAQSRYQSAKQAENQDISSFRQATIGGFDITSAGQNSNGKVTAGSLLAAQTQDVTRTRAWVKGIDKLAAMKIFPPSYLRQLVSAGPSSLATVQALLSMRHGQLLQFARNQRAIAGLGQDVALHAAARLDTKRLQRLDRAEQHAAAREAKAQRHLEKAVDGLRKDLVHELQHLHLSASLGVTGHELKVFIDSGEKHHKRTVRGSK